MVVIGLRDTARERLFPFATSAWSGEVPAFLGEFTDMVTRLPPGVSLGESLPEAFPMVPQVTVSEHDTALPFAPSPAVGPSPLAIPSPSTMPPPSISPSSGSGVSPTTAVSSGAGSSSRPDLGLPTRNRKRSRKVLESSPEVPTARPPAIYDIASMSSSTVSYPSLKKVSLPDGDRPPGWGKNCDGCTRRRRACRPPLNAVNPKSWQCTVCIYFGEECYRRPADDDPDTGAHIVLLFIDFSLIFPLSGATGS